MLTTKLDKFLELKINEHLKNSSAYLNNPIKKLENTVIFNQENLMCDEPYIKNTWVESLVGVLGLLSIISAFSIMYTNSNNCCVALSWTLSFLFFIGAVTIRFESIRLVRKIFKNKLDSAKEASA